MSEETLISTHAPRRIGPGTRLNDLYEIDALVAAGGMGEVYRAHAIETGDTVAIKTIKPEFAGSGPALALFRKEAAALHNLYHEAIIRYYVFSIDRPLGLPYLAMEFASGEALGEIAARGALPVEAIDTLRRRLASGLAAAHELGIIHRDVSPDNVILPGGNPARAKIIDFGIARSSLGGATVIGDGFAGKYGYVSPEQLGLFGGEVTPRSDIYSLGLVLAEAGLGRRLDMGQNPVDVVEKRRQVPDLAGMDGRLRPLLEAMLQPDPAKRISSMAAVAAWSPEQGAPAATPARRARATPKASRPAAPRRRLVLGAGVAASVVLAAAAGGAYWALNGPGETGPAAGDPAPQLVERTPPPALTPPASTGGAGSPAPNSPVGANPTAPRAAPPSTPATGTPAAGTPAAGPEAQNPPGAASPGTGRPQTSPAPSGARPEPQSSPRVPPETPRGPAPPPVDRTGESASPERSAPPPGTATPPAVTAADGAGPEKVASAAPPNPSLRPDPLEQVANYIRDYRGGDCLYLSPLSVGTREAAIEAYGADAPAVQAFDTAFTGQFGFDAKIQLRLVTSAQCDVVDALARQGAQRRQKLPKLALARDRLRSGEELSGTLDLPDDGPAELLLVDDEGEVHSLSRNVRRSGRRLAFSVRLQAAGPARPQLVVGVTGGGASDFKVAPGARASELFRRLGDEIGRPDATLGLAVRYVRLGE